MARDVRERDARVSEPVAPLRGAIPRREGGETVWRSALVGNSGGYAWRSTPTVICALPPSVRTNRTLSSAPTPDPRRERLRDLTPHSSACWVCFRSLKCMRGRRPNADPPQKMRGMLWGSVSPATGSIVIRSRWPAQGQTCPRRKRARREARKRAGGAEEGKPREENDTKRQFRSEDVTAKSSRRAAGERNAP